jgi:hypothetical protein
MANALLEKLKASGSIKVTTLSDSVLFNEKDVIPISVPILNIAFSGKLEGGLVSGLTIFAGPSKHYKSSMGLVCMKAYMDKYPDAIALFYDSEYGITPDYVTSFGIDADRVLHIPILHVEQLKFDIVKRLEEIKRGEKVFIFIDSVGNLASKKEVDDAMDEKSVADMSRSKALKSLFRIITPHLTTKDLPCIVIGHTYQTLEMFSKQVLSGGCLVEGTKLIMADGSFKNIQDIQVGDFVKTQNGCYPVTKTWNPETLFDGIPECYEIEFDDGSSVICSDEHEFLVDGKWVYAQNLSVGHEVGMLAE